MGHKAWSPGGQVLLGLGGCRALGCRLAVVPHRGLVEHSQEQGQDQEKDQEQVQEQEQGVEEGRNQV